MEPMDFEERQPWRGVENALSDRSLFARPDLKAAHWVVEAKAGADQEGGRLGGDLDENLRQEWCELRIEIKGLGRGYERE